MTIENKLKTIVFYCVFYYSMNGLNFFPEVIDTELELISDIP
jgi:hypothetical protein